MKKGSFFLRIAGKFFHTDAILCTALVFALMAGVVDLFNRLSFLNPFEQALSDFEMMDLVYSANIREEPGVDTSIVLVNIGNLPRRMVARELEIIAAQEPLAVGIDAGFIPDLKPEDDSVLEAAMAKTSNLVLYAMMHHTDSGQEGPFDSITFCNPRFARHGTPAYVNMVTPGKGESKFKICRSFHPVDTVNSVKLLPLSLQMAWFADSLKVKEFLKRGLDPEIINFRGNMEKFFSLDVGDMLGRDESGFMGVQDLGVSLKGKLVFMGFMGQDFTPYQQSNTIEDKFFTPMNENVAGKSNPDMFGVVVHANIASMVLNGFPIDQISDNWKYFWAVFLCYINVLGFFFIQRNYPTWYDLFVKGIQIGEVFLLLWISLLIFARYHYKADLTLAAFAIGFSGDVLEIYVGLKEKIVALFRYYLG
jgi:CHASE2 domain-containing sensor protein